jgi:hypothetical protein
VDNAAVAAVWPACAAPAVPVADRENFIFGLEAAPAGAQP